MLLILATTLSRSTCNSGHQSFKYVQLNMSKLYTRFDLHEGPDEPTWPPGYCSGSRLTEGLWTQGLVLLEISQCTTATAKILSTSGFMSPVSKSVKPRYLNVETKWTGTLLHTNDGGSRPAPICVCSVLDQLIFSQSLFPWHTLGMLANNSHEKQLWTALGQQSCL